ncbi:Cyclin-dependent kinase inhibitor 3 [Acorus gramineus]|uniref:Cyclin-dependent kinase inhibitor 3 n=1 Tax=Acorus gramineus TaxID=55184 RepID=A0AAV9AP12_ACOGR|nr:Cyclin-dependent kinase inhibitor 3 [Acorus gramineus]
MGKYMKKSKISGEVAVMEVSQSSLGVRTRARTLALKRLQKPTSSPAPEAAAAEGGGGGGDDSDGCYLQLRSRRLEKPAFTTPEMRKPREKEKVCSGRNPNPRLEEAEEDGEKGANHEASPESAGVEVSFGENVLESEGRGRATRESTPCSLIRCSETVGTPGSTTRTTNSAAANRRIQNPAHRNIPTTHEMEEFFAGAEKLQQEIFTEKYNYDPVNDTPLPGRYEWVRLDS